MNVSEAAVGEGEGGGGGGVAHRNETHVGYLSSSVLLEWELFHHCVTCFTLALLALSVLLNLTVLCNVYCHERIRKYGYFHFLLPFGLLHIVYFLAKATELTYVSLYLLGVLYVDQNGHVSNTGAWLCYVLAPYVARCCLGTDFLLLAAMTSDSLQTSCVRSSLLAKCTRGLFLLLALLLGLVVFLVVAALKLGQLDVVVDFGLLGSSSLVQDDVALITYGLYLLVFVLVPAFFVVIFGVVNWISDLNSSRPLAKGRKINRRLDHRLCLLTSLLLMLFLVDTILEFSQQLTVYESQGGTAVAVKWTTVVLKIAIDALASIYPFIFVGAMGHCCCY